MSDLAKPSGILLQDHVQHLQHEADEYFRAHPFVIKKYADFSGGKNLVKSVKASIEWHDEGKRHPFWQTACKQDHEELKRVGYRVEMWCDVCSQTHEVWRKRPRFNGKNLIKAGGKMRHEFASLEMLHRAFPNAPLTVKTAIGAHHRKLSERNQHRWFSKEFPEFEKFWHEFFGEKHFTVEGEAAFEQAVMKRYLFDGVRALLQFCDHRASAAEDGATLLPLKNFAYEFPHKDESGKRSLRGVQKKIADLQDEHFAILRAPTAAGKTDAALLWAQHQIEQNRADRLVIAMPTRFTANALAVNVAENLSAHGLYHSTARFALDNANPNESKEEKEKHEQKLLAQMELARILETPVTVTTIDHLCISLTGTREDHHAIFFNLAHACVVIDEADFYDQFTQASIITLLSALRFLGVRVMLMSATVPESARETYAASGLRATQIHEDRQDYERTRLTLIKRGAVQEPSDIADLLQRALDGEPTIIYANTVRRAQDYYTWFKDKLGARCEKEVVLYHSRFTEPHKKAKEDRLIAMLGKDAWKKGDQGKQGRIAIMTQIGEISINISADLMIADVCPIDRLAQRAGRLARFKERNGKLRQVVGELFIVEPHKDSGTGEMVLYPAPYGGYQKGVGWLPSPALESSLQLLEEGGYSAKSFVDLVNLLYPSPDDESPDVRVNRRAFEDCIVTNWLILPAQKVADDADETMEWKCRDIPAQYTVHVEWELLESLPNRSAFRQWQLHHGVQCYAHEHRIAVTTDKIFAHEIAIKDDTEIVWLARKGNYTEEVGLLFNDEARDDNII